MQEGRKVVTEHRELSLHPHLRLHLQRTFHKVL